MSGPGEHPADEPCHGICGAPACIEKAIANGRLELPASDGTGADMVIGYAPPRPRLLGDGRAPSRAFGGGTAIVVNPPRPR